MTETLTVAGVGAGYFSQFHYGSWARIPQIRLAGVADRDMGRAQATGVPAFADLAEMLDTLQPDILDIILPPAEQAGAIRTALARGIPTLICQKPFCRDQHEARAITAEAQAQGARLVIHENFRFQPWYRAIRNALKDGQIGQVLQATFRLRPGDGQGPHAYLDRQPYFRDMDRFLVRETGVHWIDTFRFLLGNPVAVYADLRRINPDIAGEDAGYILFDHPNGARAVFDGNRHLDHDADNLRRTMGEALIEGTSGTLTLTGDGAVHLRTFGNRDSRLILPPDEWDGFGGDCIHALQTHVVDALLYGDPLENTAADYLKVIEIEDAIYRSATENRKITLEPAP
jgi:predicted dehydrogenase